MTFRSRQVRITLASRTIVDDLVAEHITIDAEVVLASLALVSARLAGAFGGGREGRQAAETLR